MVIISSKKSDQTISNKKDNKIILKIDNFDDFTLYTDNTMATVVRTEDTKMPNQLLDEMIFDSLGPNVTDYNILVKTTNSEYKSDGSDTMLCSELEKKLKDETFKKAIEKAIYDYFSEDTFIFFLKDNHIRILTKTKK